MKNKTIRIISILFFVAFTIIPIKVAYANGKTLADYKRELAELEAKANRNKRLSQQAQNDINAKRQAIVNANNTIENNEKKVEESKEKVTESEEQIKVKTEELKTTIAIYQYAGSSSESVYIDYIFDSESISDMIEREAVIEQIVNYTDQQLKSLEKLIEENKQLQVQLAEDNVNLEHSIEANEKEVDKLEAYVATLASIGMDYDEELKALKNQVVLYEKAGCKDGDSIDECYYNKGSYSSSFSRPLNSGKVTQAWGHNGHAGMDLGGNVPGTPVYAPANGTVAHTAYHQSCGGNIVYIHHQVAGKAYTSEFGHLRSYAVSPGQKVVKGQIIGYVGGDSSTWYYDKCTSGTHLHYSIAYGYYLGAGANGYKSWSTFKSNTRATSDSSITGIKNVYGFKWTTR